MVKAVVLYTALLVGTGGCAATPVSPEPRSTPLRTGEVCGGFLADKKNVDWEECERRAFAGDLDAMYHLLNPDPPARFGERGRMFDSTEKLVRRLTMESVRKSAQAGDTQASAIVVSRFKTFRVCETGRFDECRALAEAGDVQAIEHALLRADTFRPPCKWLVDKAAELGKRGTLVEPALGQDFSSCWTCDFPALVQECRKRAEEGDAIALEAMITQARDRNRDLEWIRWMMARARLGVATRPQSNEPVRPFVYLEPVLDTLENGGAIPRNEVRLREFIEIGAEQGHPASALAKAAYVQDFDPKASLALYRERALADDCFGQAMLAASYMNGLLSDVNEAKAYFWWSLLMRKRSSASSYSSPAKIPPYLGDRLGEAFGGIAGPYTAGCAGRLYDTPGFRHLESKPFAQEVKDLLVQWTPGTDAPEQLDRFTDVILASEDRGATPSAPTMRSSRVALLAHWESFRVTRPFQFSEPVTADVVYERVAKSVYVVAAARSMGDLRARRDLAQGSGVAVDAKTLVTNCHIIRDRPEVRVVVAGRLAKARVSAADLEADACILSLEQGEMSPVLGVRRGTSVKVGEEVYAVGSPHGFTNSLSAGILSQTRTEGSRSFMQTTAQISSGSSGGGLFDCYGNLVGITTFKIRGAEGLNFALPIEAFVTWK
jgi:serine protease Do